MIINSWPNRKLLNYSFINQIKDIVPSIILALIMGAAVYFIGFLSLPTILILIIQVVCGALVYLAGSAILKIEPFEYLKTVVMKHTKKGKV